MTNPNPNSAPNQSQQNPAVAQRGRPEGITADQAALKITNFMNPDLKKKKNQGGDDILSDGNKKPPANQKNSAQHQQKQQKQSQKAPKAAENGQAKDDQAGLAESDAGAEEQDNADHEEGSTDIAEQDETGLDEEGQADVEGDNDTEEDSEKGDEEDDGTLYTVKVNGEDQQVTMSELLRGYSRTADYQKKTMALAKERKEIEAVKESVKDLPQQRETYAKGAERFTHAAAVMYHAMQNKFMPKLPDPELAKTDPAAYYAQRDAHQEAHKFTEALQHEVQNIATKAQAEAEAQRQKAIQEGRKKLYEAMPEMHQAPARQKLREYANSLGFTDEQIANEASHTLFICVEKARRWDELQSRKENIKPKATVQKVARRTNAHETKRAVHQRDKQNVISEHKQKGTIHTAEKALAALLNG